MVLADNHRVAIQGMPAASQAILLHALPSASQLTGSQLQHVLLMTWQLLG